MQTYVFSPDSDTYDSLALVKSKDYDKCKEFTGEDLASSWRPVSARIQKGKRGDFPSLASHIPVFSKRALDAFGQLLSDDIEVLPLKSSRK